MNWINEWLDAHDFIYSYEFRGYKVWESPTRIVVLDVTSGIKLFYNKDLFNEHYDKTIVDKDILNL